MNKLCCILPRPKNSQRPNRNGRDGAGKNETTLMLMRSREKKKINKRKQCLLGVSIILTPVNRKLIIQNNAHVSFSHFLYLWFSLPRLSGLQRRVYDDNVHARLH